MSATALQKSNSEGEGESQFEAKNTKSFNLEFSVAFLSRRFSINIKQIARHSVKWTVNIMHNVHIYGNQNLIAAQTYFMINTFLTKM